MLPPHLMIPLVLASIIGFVLLVRHFRRDQGTRRLVEEALGDDTPESALEDFLEARSRLERHRQNPTLRPAMATKIDEVLNGSTTIV